jgi:hypothetical protein
MPMINSEYIKAFLELKILKANELDIGYELKSPDVILDCVHPRR